MTRPKLVVSAVSLVEGGTLSILLDLAEHLGAQFTSDEVLYLVNGRVAHHFTGKRFEVYSWPKRSWVARLWFEKVFIRKIERRLRPRLWLSLHDITARLRETRQLLYCHNPSPFFDRSTRLPVIDVKFELFARFYAYLYRWDIHRNAYVIVQQNWMRQEFLYRYRLRKDRVLVAKPISPSVTNSASACSAPHLRRPSASSPLLLVYPTLPRVFKNVEFIGELARVLAAQPIRFIITIDGAENSYAQYIKREYGDLPNLQLIGRQPRPAMLQMYEQADALIFPSRLETWGLPLSEFMSTGKPIFAADLPYAREVLSGYKMADVLPLGDIPAAAAKLRAFCSAHFSAEPINVAVEQPLCPNWSAFATWLARTVEN
jgi:glycosyltransferase involved in cell wall biosynthesis